MANGFNTDYSFLNLPEAGSSARGPIERPSFDPTDFSFDSVNRFAPKNLPTVDTFAPSFAPLSEDENAGVLSNARPFEDVQSLGATFGQKMAEVERFFGEQVNNLKDNINSLENSKSEINIELENAIQLQDQIRAEAAQKQLEALEQQKQELQMQLQQAVSEAESQGIDAVAAAETTAAEKLSNVTADFQNEINNLTGARDSAIAERDQAISQQDTIRADAANQQAQALDAQAGDYQAQLDELTGQSSQYEGQLSERDQTIADLQAQLEGMQAPPGQLPPGEAPPGETPPPPPPGQTPPGGFTGAPEGMMSYQDFLAQGGSAEDYQSYLNKFLYSSDNLNKLQDLQNPSQLVIDAVQNSLATGVPAITNDGVQDMINKMGTGFEKAPPQKNPRDDFISIGGAGGNNGMFDDKFIEERNITRKPFIAELPPMPPKRDDFMSIEQLPNPRIDGIGGFLGKKLGRMGRR